MKSINKDQLDDILPGINMGISKSGNDLHEKKHNDNKAYIISYEVALVLTEQYQYILF